jgi:hypothetical protein
MVKAYIVSFTKTNIASGATVSDKYTPTEDLVLKRVYVRRTDGNKILNSTFSLNIGKATFGKDFDPNVFGDSPYNSYPLDENCPTSVDISWTFVNGEGATIGIVVSFVFERKTEAAP